MDLSLDCESKLLFSVLVKLLTPVVSGASRSVNASYQMSSCEVSCQAVYDKLKGVEPEVSASLVRETAAKLRQIQDKSKSLRDDVVPGYHTFVIDGKTYNGTEHRLKESRRDARAPLPGRAIALLDLLTNLPSSVTAAKISDSYRQRWTIETCLGHLSHSLNAEINTLA